MTPEKLWRRWTMQRWMEGEFVVILRRRRDKLVREETGTTREETEEETEEEIEEIEEEIEEEIVPKTDSNRMTDITIREKAITRGETVVTEETEGTKNHGSFHAEILSTEEMIPAETKNQELFRAEMRSHEERRSHEISKEEIAETKASEQDLRSKKTDAQLIGETPHLHTENIFPFDFTSFLLPVAKLVIDLFYLQREKFSSDKK